MKIWYFSNPEQYYLIAYGSTPEEALKRFIKSRMDKNNESYNSWVTKEMGELSYWDYQEFTENDYDGCLYFS